LFLEVGDVVLEFVLDVVGAYTHHTVDLYLHLLNLEVLLIEKLLLSLSLGLQLGNVSLKIS
jgi:hypothetical protein